MDRNLSGQTFGRWHVIGYAGKNNGYKVWMCKCDCGTIGTNAAKYCPNCGARMDGEADG